LFPNPDKPEPTLRQAQCQQVQLFEPRNTRKKKFKRDFNPLFRLFRGIRADFILFFFPFLQEVQS
jgi:hypothetical protein